MSIKGIDAQIMVTRTAELAKESSNQLKKNELSQEYMNIQAAEFERQKKQTAPKTNAAENPRLHPDRDGSGDTAASYKHRQPKENKNDDTTLEELKVLPDPNTKHKIDIKI